MTTAICVAQANGHPRVYLTNARHRGNLDSYLAVTDPAMNQERRHFDEELEKLKTRLLTMGGLAEERLRRAMRGLVERDHQSLVEVIAGDSRIDELQIEIDEHCFTLLALHQPVASDLRTVVSAIKFNADLERVAALAVHIGEAPQR